MPIDAFLRLDRVIDGKCGVSVAGKLTAGFQAKTRHANGSIPEYKQ